MTYLPKNNALMNLHDFVITVFNTLPWKYIVEYVSDKIPNSFNGVDTKILYTGYIFFSF